MTKEQGQKHSKFKKLTQSSVLALAAVCASSPLNNDDHSASSEHQSSTPHLTAKQTNDIPAFKHHYPHRGEKIEVFKENCVSTARNNKQQDKPDKWESLNQLKNIGTVSRAVYEIARSADMYFCWYEDPELSGEFSDDYGVGMLKKDSTTELNDISDALRSIIAGLHQLRGLNLNPEQGSLYSNFSNRLAAEAIKDTVRIIVALELSEEGQDRVVNDLTDQEKALQKVFLSHFKQLQPMLNDTNEAISFAASYIVNSLLRDTSFIEKHKHKALTDYFWALHNGTLTDIGTNNIDTDLIVKLGQVTQEFSLSEHVSVPTMDEFLEISEDLKTYHDYLEYQKQNSLNPNSNDKLIYQIKLEDIASIINKSSNVYSFPQAFDRADIISRSNINYSDRKGDYYKSCVQVDYTQSQVKEPVSSLWRNIQEIKAHDTLIGQLALEHAKNEDLFICYSELEDGVGGLWSNDDEGLIQVSSVSADSSDYQLLVKIHEIVHSMQSDKGLLGLKYAWSLSNWQMAIMSYEASAKVADHLLAFELKLKGYQGPWDTIKDEHVSKTIEKEFLEQTKNGVPYKTALEMAGSEGWKSLFEQQSWLDFYNKRVLKSYFSYLAQGKTIGLGSDNYSLGTAKRTGELSKEFNVTRFVEDLPEPISRFGQNQDMKEAFEYLNLERMALVLGRGHETYLNELERLEENNNKFLGVDIKIADNSRDPWEQLRCYAGLDKCNIGEEKLEPSKYKIAMRNHSV